MKFILFALLLGNVSALAAPASPEVIEMQVGLTWSKCIVSAPAENPTQSCVDGPVTNLNLAITLDQCTDPKNSNTCAGSWSETYTGEGQVFAASIQVARKTDSITGKPFMKLNVTLKRQDEITEAHLIVADSGSNGTLSDAFFLYGPEHLVDASDGSSVTAFKPYILISPKK